VAAAGDPHRTNQTRPPAANGRHERIHLTLKKEATKPAAKNFLQQQAQISDRVWLVSFMDYDSDTM
jgi:hypothetical protein